MTDKLLVVLVGQIPPEEAGSILAILRGALHFQSFDGVGILAVRADAPPAPSLEALRELMLAADEPERRRVNVLVNGRWRDLPANSSKRFGYKKNRRRTRKGWT